MVKLINEYAKQNGFTMILEAEQLQVYYITPDSVITDEMAKRYDAAYPVEGAATPAAPAPKPAAPTSKPK